MADTSAVKEITEKLEQGVKDLFESDKYAEYLKTMSRFHSYSTRNTLLIYMQYPTAHRVAGYTAWKQKFNRQVKKGEQGIRIFAPIPFVKNEEKEKLDPITGRQIIGDDGQPLTEAIEIKSARFKVVTVFAEQQTVGDPLPELIETLTGDVERYELFMDALHAVSPLPIEFTEMSDADGKCYFGEKIEIKKGMTQIQTVSAVIHEITHAKIHDLNNIVGENTKPKDRRTEEVEAEGISFVVNAHYGIDTGANSFGYVATWSKGKELKELNASLDTIRRTAASLIDAIDEKYRALAKERGIDLIVKTAAIDAPDKTIQPREEENIAVEYTEFQKRGFNIAKAYENLPLQDRLNIIAQTFGCQTAHVETHPCGGKWRGTSDISIELDKANSLTPFITSRNISLLTKKIP